MQKNSSILDVDERKVLDLLADAWNAFCKLEQIYVDHPTEFRHAIHQAERVVMVRGVKRVLDKEVEEARDVH